MKSLPLRTRCLAQLSKAERALGSIRQLQVKQSALWIPTERLAAAYRNPNTPCQFVNKNFAV